MIVSGLIDNTVRIWDVRTAKCLHVLQDHTHFVQGVCWDPLGRFIASQSCDRSVVIYNCDTSKGILQVKMISKNAKMDVKENNNGNTNKKSSTEIDKQDLKSSAAAASSVPPSPSSRAGTDLMPPPPPSPSRPLGSHSPRMNSPAPKAKTMRMYHDETLTSFFRRLTFLPDGSMLLTPASQIKSAKDEEMLNTFNSSDPVAHLPGHKRPSIAVRASPVAYELKKADQSNEEAPINKAFDLPYRLVYAVATQDTVYIYDTQHTKPLCMLSNLHYATFTDLAWSEDGNNLVLSSTDGYCSIVSFEQGELGTRLSADKLPQAMIKQPESTDPVLVNPLVVNELLVKRKMETSEESVKKVKA